LAPLSALTLSKTKWKWTEKKCQTAFDKMKQLISRKTLLTYSDFKLSFEIYTDASIVESKAYLSKVGDQVAFYNRKLNLAQTWYTITEQELLSIVKTL
jgi:RNase H-like domain found in reverse transcriptase